MTLLAVIMEYIVNFASSAVRLAFYSWNHRIAAVNYLNRNNHTAVIAARNISKASDEICYYALFLRLLKRKLPRCSIDTVILLNALRLLEGVVCYFLVLSFTSWYMARRCSIACTFRTVYRSFYYLIAAVKIWALSLVFWLLVLRRWYSYFSLIVWHATRIRCMLFWICGIWFGV